MSDFQSESEELLNEAKDLLNSLMRVPENCRSEAADRFVDCVIYAAVLKIRSELFDEDRNREI